MTWEPKRTQHLGNGCNNANHDRDRDLKIEMSKRQRAETIPAINWLNWVTKIGNKIE